MDSRNLTNYYDQGWIQDYWQLWHKQIEDLLVLFLVLFLFSTLHDFLSGPLSSFGKVRSGGGTTAFDT